MRTQPPPPLADCTKKRSNAPPYDEVFKIMSLRVVKELVKALLKVMGVLKVVRCAVCLGS